MPHVTYRFQESKNGVPDGGEDRLVITDDFIAVIDGATSKSGEKFDGKTGGILAAEAVAQAIQKLPRASDAFQAVACLSAAVQENVIDRYVPQTNAPTYTGDRPNASVVIYSANRQEIWRIGDSHFKIGQGPRTRTNFGKKKIDQETSKLRAAYIQAMLKRHTTTIEALRQDDLGRRIIMPLLENQPLLMNNANTLLGYGVIDGRDVPEKFIEVYPIDPEGTPHPKKIILASDGVLFPLGNHKRQLDKQLAYYKQDSLMIGRYKSTKGVAVGQKWHDDITIVEFSVGGVSTPSAVLSPRS